MDPFSNLPPELCLEILIACSTGFHFQSILHASSTMFRLFHSPLGTTVQRGCLGRWFNEPLLRDAAAVVGCPSLAMDRTGVRQVQLSNARHVEYPLLRWESHTLQYSIDIPAVFIVVAAYVRRLEIYMADFLTKATSSYLPHAYLTIPSFSTKYTLSKAQLQTAHPSPRKKTASHVAATLQQLTLAEWERLAHAFLRHELFCIDLSADAVQNRHHHATWMLLENYGLTSHPRELDMMQCVQEYIRVLYDALARETEANGLCRPNPVPDLPVDEYTGFADEQGHQRGLFFPDCKAILGGYSYADILAVRGLRSFDILVRISNMSQIRCFLMEPYRAYLHVHFPKNSIRADSPTTMETESQVWNKRRRLLEKAQSSPNDNARTGNFMLLTIYRQRAWALFDDDRLYPAGLNFPKLREIQDQVEEWPEWYFGAVRLGRLGYMKVDRGF